MQKNWIGKSEGAQFKLKVNDSDISFEVFTTRPDTLFGMTFAVISPEHELMGNILEISDNKKQIKEYIEKAKSKSEFERMSISKEKTGVDTQLKVINPMTNEEVPLWIADYVLINYGTGAIMAVPAHDQRDYDFAKKYNIEIRQVIMNKESQKDVDMEAYVEEGVLINSGEFNELNSHTEASLKVIQHLEKNKIGEKKTTFRLGDSFNNPRFSPVKSKVVWKYRGQIVPQNKYMQLDLHVKNITKKDGEIIISADANLWREDLRIYEISDIVLGISES